MNGPFIEQIHSGGILEIRFNLNEQNTLEIESLKGFEEILESHRSNTKIKAIALSSEVEGFFSNGLSPSLFLDAGRSDIQKNVEMIFATSTKLFFYPVPVISILSGHCMGAGAVLALYSDYRFIADRRARIGFPEALIGMSFPAFTARILSDLIGTSRARDILYEGRALKGKAALDMGLVDGVYPQEELHEKSFQKLATIVRSPVEALRGIKASLRNHYKTLFLDTYESDVSIMVETLLSKNTQEGFRAILEKRPPSFE